MAYREPLAGPTVVVQVDADLTVTAAPGQTVALFVDATAADVTITLPAAASCEGMTVKACRVDETGNVVTVAATGSDTIVGSNPFPIPLAAYDGYVFTSGGTTLWGAF